MKPKKPKIGIALSGGGAKGIAHLGVLKVLEELGIKIDRMSGVSAGAIVCALYADGNTPEDICSFLQKSNLYQMVSLNLAFKGGFSNMTKFKDFLSKYLKAKTFEELRIPITINATELNEGKNVYFNEGILLDRVIASATVPIFFTPTQIDGKDYVDGGMFCNLPAAILRQQGCDLVIGVHVNPISYTQECDNLFGVMERVFHLAVNGNTIEQKRACDIVIETNGVKDIGMFNAAKADEIFRIGYEEAHRVLDSVDWKQLSSLYSYHK